MGTLSRVSALMHTSVTLIICFRSEAFFFDSCGGSYSEFMWYMNVVAKVIIIIIIYCLDFLTLQVLKLINYCASHNW